MAFTSPASSFPMKSQFLRPTAIQEWPLRGLPRVGVMRIVYGAEAGDDRSAAASRWKLAAASAS